MKQILARLVRENDIANIVETLSNICLEQAKQARRAKKPEQAAMRESNYYELSMTTNSMYHSKCY